MWTLFRQAEISSLIEISPSWARGFAKCASGFTELSSPSRPVSHKNECVCHTAFYSVLVLRVFVCLPRQSLEVLNHPFLLREPVDGVVRNQKVNKCLSSLVLEIIRWGNSGELAWSFLNNWHLQLPTPRGRKCVPSMEGQESFPLRHNSGHTSIICQSALEAVPFPISHS